MQDLLYGMMLESYNDCAYAIAEHIGGSVEGFSDMLNLKANELGCYNTYFLTPNGLDDEDEISFHHTTANDLLQYNEILCMGFTKIRRISENNPDNGIWIYR